MWLFTPQAFLSIVAHRDDARLRLVRARRPGEIEVLFPNAKVQATPHADYPYRAVLPAPEVAAAVAKAAEQSAYPNGCRARCQQGACFAQCLGGDGLPIRTGALKRRPYPLLPRPTSLFCFCSKFKWGLNGV